MKKILIVSDCFYPSEKRGGAAVSVTNLAEALSSHYEVHVFTTIYEAGSGEKYDSVHVGKNFINNYYVYYFDRKRKNLFYINYLISKINPGLIYVSSLFSIAFSLPVFASNLIGRKRNIIVSPRGEMMPNSLLNGKQKKRWFLKITKALNIYNNLYFHAASESERIEIIKVLNVSGEKVKAISNISNFKSTNIIRPHKSPGKLRMVSITRITKIKNIDYFIDLLNQFEGDLEYYIYGNIDDADYWKLCESKMAALKSNIKVIYKGYITQDEIKGVLETMHLFISTTFSENFGHSIVEALINGCPILISNNTPWNDINQTKYNKAIDLKDTNTFLETLDQFRNMGDEEYKLACSEASSYIESKLNMEKVIQNYFDFFNEL